MYIALSVSRPRIHAHAKKRPSLGILSPQYYLVPENQPHPPGSSNLQALTQLAKKREGRLLSSARGPRSIPKRRGGQRKGRGRSKKSCLLFCSATTHCPLSGQWERGHPAVKKRQRSLIILLVLFPKGRTLTRD